MNAALALPPPLLTVADYEALSFEGRVELIDGQLHRREIVPGGHHAFVAAELCTELNLWRRATRLGHVLVETAIRVQTDPDRIRVADLCFLSHDRLALPPAGVVTAVPELVVEIISPNERATDLEDKLADYRRLGVPLLWLVYPHARRITALQAGAPPRFYSADDRLEGGDLLPGFACAVAPLFPPA